MARPKTKDGERCNFYLANKEKLQQLADSSHMSMASWIDWIVENTSRQLDVDVTLRNLENQASDIRAQIDLLTKQETKILETIQKYKDKMPQNKELIALLDKDLEQQKQKFVGNLLMQFLNGATPTRVKEFAVSQSIVLKNRWTADELFMEAFEQYKKINEKKTPKITHNISINT